MNGNFFSEVQLQQELQEKLKLLQILESLRTEPSILSRQLDTMIRNLPNAFRSILSQEINAAQEWMTNLPPAEDNHFNIESELTLLKEAHERQVQLTQTGRHRLESLQLAFTPKADAKGQELAKQLATIHSQLFQQRYVLQLWYGKKAITKWEKELAYAKDLLYGKLYSRLESNLADLQEEIKEKSQWASQQEEKHQQRLYLLKALRQVATKLDFTEQGTPLFENTGDRGSHIMLLVNTPAQEHIDFYLTLEGVTSVSQMDDERYSAVLDMLCQQLEKECGIQLHFRPVEDETEN